MNAVDVAIERLKNAWENYPQSPWSDPAYPSMIEYVNDLELVAKDHPDVKGPELMTPPAGFKGRNWSALDY